MTDPAELPPVPGWLQNGFHRFLTRYLRRHFHAVAVERETRMDVTVGRDLPVIVYGNHPSWWDPMVAHFLNWQLLPNRQFYAPIDATALDQYRVLAKLGFYGVATNESRGAGNFLKKSLSIARHAETALWITPEGRFADARDQTADLMPGLPHLCNRLEDGWVVPLALEYVFWDERLPVCLAKTALPFRIRNHADWDKARWGSELDAKLRSNQAELATLAIARDDQAFDNLLRGKRGAGFVYDSFRTLRAKVGGRRLRAQHGDHFE